MTDEEEGEEGNGEKSKKITVEHVFKRVSSDGTPQDFEPPQVVSDKGDNSESVEEENIRLKAQMEALALKEFENEKEKILSGVVDDAERLKLENYIGDDPNKLELVKLVKGIPDSEDDGVEPVPPKGKVRGLLRKPKGNSEVQGNVIGELYKIRTKKATSPDEIAEQNVADGKINQMFEQLEDGLRDRPKGNSYDFQVAQCTNCGTVLFGKDANDWATKGICNACGYKPKRRQ